MYNPPFFSIFIFIVIVIRDLGIRNVVLVRIITVFDCSPVHVKRGVGRLLLALAVA